MATDNNSGRGKSITDWLTRKDSTDSTGGTLLSSKFDNILMDVVDELNDMWMIIKKMSVALNKNTEMITKILYQLAEYSADGNSNAIIEGNKCND